MIPLGHINSFKGAMELWQLGVFRPTSPFTTFRYSQLKMTFRQLQSGRHSGKLVFTIDGDDLVETLPWTLPPCQFQEDAIYLLSGGLGRLGRSAARWMASRGAKHFLSLSDPVVAMQMRSFYSMN
ncbi:Phthiocerol synthesis polyketide synthase type I PpsC [Penicillium chrysogenum]|uniref:Phthiocerol synthesis polyketide synthase type I PpsC n=1 Tax=Penicillium chrysogenum TaxID=5076 RepID=A0A167YV00_PENCH|nr:Phthiocerol synthesis polyketide synthase type I PpsC [Penicillium chrysogenum]